MKAIIYASLFGIIMALSSQVRADGVEAVVGNKIIYSCTSPTTFADGSKIPAGTDVQIRAYATQSPATVGNVVATGKCPLTVDTASFPTGQWFAYVTAFVSGRPEGGLSAAVPFVLSPDLTVAPGIVTDLTVDLETAQQ